MNALYDAQRALADAIRVGGQHKPAVHPGASGAVFSQALWEQAIADLALFERLQVKASWELSAKALRAARDGRHATSLQYFTEALAPVSAQGTPGRVALLCQSFYEAAHAYLDYRCGDWRQSCVRLASAMEMDVALERRHGVTILYLHRMQLLHNRMRLEMRCGRIPVAVNLGARMVGHLQGFAPSPAELAPPCGDVLRGSPRETVEAMILQVAGDVAVALAGADSGEGVGHLESIRHMVDEGATPLMRRVHLWACAKAALLACSPREFFAHAETLLREGRGEIGLLWEAVLVDVLACCRNTSGGREMQGVALEELKLRPPLHPKLAEHAQRLALDA